MHNQQTKNLGQYNRPKFLNCKWFINVWHKIYVLCTYEYKRIKRDSCDTQFFLWVINIDWPGWTLGNNMLIRQNQTKTILVWSFILKCRILALLCFASEDWWYMVYACIGFLIYKTHIGDIPMTYWWHIVTSSGEIMASS